MMSRSAITLRATASAHWTRTRLEWVLIWLAAGVALGADLRLGFVGLAGSDWTSEARPSVEVLLAGHLAEFLRLAPAYGGSLLLRAPFMAPARLWHADSYGLYVCGAAPCLAAMLGLALVLCREMRQTGWTARALCVVLLIGNPLVPYALRLGHPEELLGAALCVGAVLSAERGHAAWSGLLVGLAVANKSWGVLAAGPVLVTLPRGRGRACLAMLAGSVPLTVPFLLAHSTGPGGPAAAAGVGTGGIFKPWQLWWFLGPRAAPGSSAWPHLAPDWLKGYGHVLPIAIMPPITLLHATLAERRCRRDGLLLLALLLLLRCALDPWDISYYAIPFLTALLAWDATRHEGLPMIALLSTLGAWFVLVKDGILFDGNADLVALAFAVVVVPVIAVITRQLFGRESGPPLAATG